VELQSVMPQGWSPVILKSETISKDGIVASAKKVFYKIVYPFAMLASIEVFANLTFCRNAQLIVRLVLYFEGCAKLQLG